jgi:glutaredoxin 3
MSLLPRALPILRIPYAATLSTATAINVAQACPPPIFPLRRKASPTVQVLVEKSIAENTVTVFSKSWCPHSKRAKALLQAEFPNLKTQIFELDQIPEGGEMQAYLMQKTGQRTVPNIFINDKHIGGCAAIHALNNKGDLAVMLNSQ